jgi:hypothetical protein
MLGSKNAEDYGRFIQLLCNSSGVTNSHLFKTHTDPHEIDHMISFDEGLDEHSELWTSGRVGVPTFPGIEHLLEMVFHHTNLQILPAEKNRILIGLLLFGCFSACCFGGELLARSLASGGFAGGLGSNKSLRQGFFPPLLLLDVTYVCCFVLLARSLKS